MAAGRLYRINGSLEEGIHESWHKYQADKHREENEGGTNKIKTKKRLNFGGILWKVQCLDS